MKAFIVAFMASFLFFGGICWIASYGFFKQQFEQRAIKSNESIKNAISTLELAMDEALKQGLAEIERKYSSLIKNTLVEEIERTNSIILTRHIDQIDSKVNTLLKKSIDEVEDLSDKLCRKLSKVYEKEREDHESKKHEILAPMTEAEYEEKLARWRRSKTGCYSEIALKDLRRRFKEGGYKLSEFRRLYPNQFFHYRELRPAFSKEDEAHLEFCYDQWIRFEYDEWMRLEEVLFVGVPKVPPMPLEPDESEINNQKKPKQGFLEKSIKFPKRLAAEKELIDEEEKKVENEEEKKVENEEVVEEEVVEEEVVYKEVEVVEEKVETKKKEKDGEEEEENEEEEEWVDL